MNKKIFQTALVIFIWAILAFGMSVVYYWLKDVGFIWDNPDPGNDSPGWNGRKVIFGIVGIASFILTIVKIVLIWDKDAIKP